MRRFILIFIASALLFALVSCGGGGGTDIFAESETGAQSEQTVSFELEVKYESVSCFSTAVSIPENYERTEAGGVIIFTSPEYPQAGDNVTVTRAETRLDDFTERNMLYALKSEFEFEQFNGYEKTSLNGADCVIYDFDTELEGVRMNIKQLNVPCGEYVVTYTFCLINERYAEVFGAIADSVTLE